MEAEKNNQEYDEIEKLLCEIPNETSEKSHMFQHDGSDTLSQFDTAFVKETSMNYGSKPSCDTYNASLSTNHVVGMAPTDNASSRVQHDPMHSSDGHYKISRTHCGQGTAKFPPEQSLASKLKVLCLNDETAVLKSTRPEYNPSSLPFLYSPRTPPSSHMNNRPELDLVEVSVPFSTMPNGTNLPNRVFEGHSSFVMKDEANIQNGNANFLKNTYLERQMSKEIQGHALEQWRTFPVYSGTMSVNAGSEDDLKLCPEFSMQDFRLPTLPYKQQYYINGQSPSCISYQQPHMSLCKMENERTCNKQFHNFNLQQRQDIESYRKHGRKDWSSASETLSVAGKHPYFEMTVHLPRHIHPLSHWNENVVNEPYSQWDPSSLNSCLGRYNSKGFCSKHDSDSSPPEDPMLTSSFGITSPKRLSRHHRRHEDNRQTFPDKILSRSGLNSLQNFKFGSITVNQSTRRVEESEKAVSDISNCGNLNSCKGYNNLDAQECLNFDLHSSDDKDSAENLPKKCHSADEVVGRVCALTKDQQGCRLLQELFTEGTDKDVEKIFVEIIDEIAELMIDPFANYLVQKLLDVCSEKQRMQIVHQITQPAGELIRISRNQHGTRAVQKLIGKVNSPHEFAMIVKSLEPAIVSLMKDRNGNHVAQRCLQQLSSEYREILFHAAVFNCVELAKDPQGCVVLQKCLFHLEGNMKLHLLSNIISESLHLSQDQFGNYIVQLILEDLKIPCATSEILDQLEGHFAVLAVQKYSSHVMQKCLKYGGERRERIIFEITYNPRFLDIMQDRFGNYVVQTALSESKGALRAVLLEAIRPHVPALRNHQYGKNVFCCISSKK